MHASASTAPQAMSNDHNYRPRSPELSGFADQQPPPRLQRLPSYQIEEPNLPQGYSFSPRGSYDASPFFSPSAQQSSTSYFGQRAGSQPNQFKSPPQFTPVTSPQRQSQPKATFYHPYASSPPRQPHQSAFAAQGSPFQPLQIVPPDQQFLSNQQGQTFDDDMARLRSRKPVNYNDNQNDLAQYDEPASYIPPPAAAVQPPPPSQFMQLTPVPGYNQQSHHQQLQHQQQQQHQHQHQHQMPLPQALPPQLSVPPTIPSNIDVRTKFPVARIKRIMQADEDVGKVAQATPTAVSKALELFMIALVTKGASEAKSQNSKRVTATHLKTALLNDPQFDFLNDICESVPDEGAKKARSKSETKSEHDDMDSDDDMGGAAPKKKGKAKKPNRKGTSEGDSE